MKKFFAIVFLSLFILFSAKSETIEFPEYQYGPIPTPKPENIVVIYTVAPKSTIVPDPTIVIWSDIKTTYLPGEIITLYSSFEGHGYWRVIGYQWEYSENGIEWFPIESANEETYIFLASFDSLNKSYRLTVSFEAAIDD